MTRRIGIYGGSFNPIHNGHIALAHAFLEKAGLNEVWFIVSPQNPFKVGERLLDDDMRYEMVCAALSNEPKMVASDYEFHLPRPSYMWNTLTAMDKDYPDCDFTLLIGGDNWVEFKRWYHYEDILKTYHIAVYPRRGDDIPTGNIPENVTFITTPLIDISSTMIRERIAKGQSIDGLVPPNVAETICRENLYSTATR